MAIDAVLPKIGDLVYLCEDVGVYGEPPMWLRVLGVKDTLSTSHVYVKGYDVDRPGTPRVFYIRLAGLQVTPEAEAWR